MIRWNIQHPEDLGIYLHIPFCEQKCIYCDFYSVVSFDLWDAFFDALEQEIQLWAERLATAGTIRVRTMFWGGGTPSLLHPHHVERIYCLLAAHFDLTHLEEWTVECNPESVDREKLRAYRSLGINRISIGVQSLQPRELQFLGRIHSAAAAEQAVEQVLAAGFDNVNADLIFGLPNQTVEAWEQTLDQVLRWQLPHLSVYALTYERGTPLYTLWQRAQVERIPEEVEAEMYRRTMEKLTAAGYDHYEVSNFAQPGYRCRHNLRYWERKEYLAFGPSAHGFLGSHRYANVRSLRQYCQQLTAGQLPFATVEHLGPLEELEELLYLGLRAQGVRLQELQARTSVDVTAVATAFCRRYAEYCTIDDERLRLTDAGYAVADSLVVELLTALTDPAAAPLPTVSS